MLAPNASFTSGVSFLNDRYQLTTRALGLLQGVGGTLGGLASGTGAFVAGAACPVTFGGGCLAAGGLGVLTVIEFDQAQAGFRTAFSGRQTNSFGALAISSTGLVNANTADLGLGLAGLTTSLAGGGRVIITRLGDDLDAPIAGALDDAARQFALEAGQGSGRALDTLVIPAGQNCVYSCIVNGDVVYVGITNDVLRRGSEHLAQRAIVIRGIRGLEDLSRADARAVEQVLIEYHGLGSRGGTLLNRINSISPTRNKTAYEQALIRGAQILTNIRYPGF